MFLLYWEDPYLAPGNCGVAAGTEDHIRQVYLALRAGGQKKFSVTAPGGRACFPGEPRWWRGPYINPLLADATPINGITHWQPEEGK